MTNSASAPQWKQLWLPLLSVLVSLLIGLSAVASSTIIAILNTREERGLTEFQVTFLDKQQTYTAFMARLSDTFDAAALGDATAVVDGQKQLEGTYFSLEPYLSEDVRSRVWSDILEFYSITFYLLDNKSLSDEQRNSVIDSFLQYRRDFRDILIPELFNK